VACIRSHSSSGVSSSRPRNCTAAFAWKTSRPPKADTVSSISRRSPASVETSATRASDLPPAVAIATAVRVGVLEIDARDRGAFLGQAERRGLTDPGPGAGDDRRLPL